MENHTIPRRVKLLRDDVARKIAAGEVIDRPFSVVRELLDNAVDAGASSIQVDLSKGGIGLIRVSDDGCGMSEEDLKLCFLPHATSKIETVDDLYHTTSLGFRGEALGSIGSCARLRIISGSDENINRLIVENGELSSLQPWRGRKGTTVEVEDIFYNLPGRRRFLKSAQSEGTLCRTTFLEKAVPFPDIHFQLFNDGNPKTTLPPGDRIDRVCTAYPSIFPRGTTESFSETGEGFSFTIVHASPAVYRRDRRYIHVYLNKRRIQEYSLLQAVEYGFSTVLPGGSYPVAMLFLEVDPEQVDFNIHPAKREARVRILKEIHHAVSSSIQLHVNRPSNISGTRSRSYNEAPDLGEFNSIASEKQAKQNLAERREELKMAFRSFPSADRSKVPGPIRSRRPADAADRIDSWKEIPRKEIPEPGPESRITYIGQAFDLFLICQVEDELYMVDQHAAHERILYEKFSRPDPNPQGLILPLEVEAPGDAKFCADLLEKLKPLGFHGRTGEGTILIESIPSSYRGVEKELTAFLEGAAGSLDNLLRDLYADMSCKAAVKDGETLDRVSADSLLKEVFKLPDPRCPHGRPVWYRISREELFAFVGRT